MIELIRNRRSIRKFKSQKIEKEKTELLKEAALRSPTSRNIKPWEFIFVQDKDTLKKLSTAKEHGSFFLEHAPLGIVICADEKRSDVWIEDASIAAILLQMQAQSMDLGSCWIQVRLRKHNEGQSAEDYVRKVLKLEKHTRIEAILAIGYPDELREPVDFDDLEFIKIKEI